MNITIDSKVPIPAPKVGPLAKYPFKTLKVKDSFFVPDANRSLQVYAFNRAKQLGMQIATRTVVENEVKGLRIWRVK